MDLSTVTTDSHFHNNNHLEKKTDYYSILGCSQDATFQEIKRNYQSLIKKCHPDKQNQEETSIISDDVFVLIDKAFKTLRDEKTRKQYDASLLQDSFSENSLIYAEISKGDMNFTDNVFNYPCRCGENFEIDEKVLCEDECIIECSECTNCILIK